MAVMPQEAGFGKSGLRDGKCGSQDLITKSSHIIGPDIFFITPVHMSKIN
jgi:hypothetical protein